MPKINNYESRPPLRTDKLLGTDNPSGQTANFTISSIEDFILGAKGDRKIPVTSQVDFTTAEPTAYEEGARYINTVTGEGSSSSTPVTANYIYEARSLAWVEIAPAIGFTVWNIDQSKNFTYSGTTWVSDFVTQAQLDLKADQAATYTETETNALLDAKANQSTTYTKTEVDTSLATKANQATTYTITQANTLLDLKANQATTYTKAEADGLFSGGFVGAITPTSAAPTQNGLYSCSTSGTYTNFGGEVVSLSNQVVSIAVGGAQNTFTQIVTPTGITIESAPIAGSANVVSSGGLSNSFKYSNDISKFQSGRRDLAISNNNVYLQSDNTFSSAFAGAVVSDYYFIKENDVLLYTGRFGNAAVACLFLDINGSIVGFEENTGGLIDVADREITAPSNAYRVRFSSLNSTLKIGIKSDVFEDIKTNTQNITSNDADILVNSSGISSLNLALTQADAIVDVNNLYLRNDNTLSTTFPGAKVSNYYSCSNITSWLYTGRYGNLGVACVFVDVNDNVVGFEENTGGLINVTDLKIIVPANAHRVRFSSLNSTLKITVNSGLREKVEEQENNNRLLSTTFLAIGDSMVYGHTLPSSDNWVTKLGARNSMTVINAGINGNTIMPNGDGNSMLERYSSLTSNADFVCLFGGTNDFNQSLTVGSYGDSWANGGSEETFYGALNDLALGLLTKFPDKRLFFITPYYKASGIMPYVNAIVEVCNAFGISVFNNVKNGGVYFQNTAQRNALTLQDNTHLNAAGMTYASYKYENFMSRL